MTNKEIIRKYLVRLLSKKDYCSYVLTTKLNNKFNGESKTIDELINEFKNKKIINDEDYMLYIIYKAFERQKGLLYIKYKLIKLGYPKEVYLKVLDEYNEREIESIKEYALSHSDMTKEELCRKLSNRGYQKSSIYEAVL